MTDLRSLPLTANHWGTYRVEATDGQVTQLHRFEHDPDPSPIGHGAVDTLADALRITGPMVRKSWLEGGPGTSNHLRGKEPFVAVSWDHINELLAGEIQRVRTQFGNQAIFGGSYGWSSAGRFHHAQSQLHRFLNTVGGYTKSHNTYSFAAGEVIVPHVLGNFRPFVYQGPTWTDVIKHAELVVAFGGVRVNNGQINPGGLGRHAQRSGVLGAVDAGVHFVNISPIRSDLMNETQGDWIAPRPSTDTAIMLGLAHTLLSENLHDQDFLAKYTVGFEPFAAYLLGEVDGITKSVEWAASIADVDAETLRVLARRMASSRTIISTSWSLTRQDHGEQPFWAAIVLASMLGQIGLPGRGIAFGLSALNDVGDNTASIPAVALPQGTNLVGEFIPVARISDMLLNPGTEFTYNGKTQRYPDIKMVWWAGGNPFHHHQDLGRLQEAWQRPDTIVANEWTWNAHAKHADVVLAATTPLEREDLLLSSQSSTIVYMSKVATPNADARDDYDIFAGIAGQLDLKSEFTEDRTARQWLEWIYEHTLKQSADVDIELPTFDELRTSGFFEIPTPTDPSDAIARFRAGKPLDTPSGRIEISSATVAGFGYPDCPGHPTWLEPYEWLGQEDRSHPLHLISNQPTSKLHSQLDHGSVSRAAKVNGRERVALHPKAAAERGLAAGDLVRVFNLRGSCLASLVVDETLRADIAQMPTGAWFDPAEIDGKSWCKHGNPNVLTRDKGTSGLAQGPTAQTCLVEIEKYVGAELRLTAFEPPEIIRPRG